MMTTHSYSFGDLKGSYLRALLGIFICIAPSLMGAKMVGIVPILIGVAILFSVYGLRAVLRQMLDIVIDDGQLTTHCLLHRVLYWDQLSEFSLSYFTNWRSDSTGWMELRIRGAGKSMYFESSLSDFEFIVRRAIVAANKNNIKLNSVTLKNIDALNIATADHRLIL
jgi:hypothetical protein